MKMDTGLAHDVFRQGRHPLDPFFKPRSVAVIGATETPGSVGRTVMSNLVATSFGGAARIVDALPMPPCIDAETGFPYSVGVIKRMGMDVAVVAPSGSRR